MKLPKERKLNAYLINQYKQQETRIKNCSLSILHSLRFPDTEGTFESLRPKRL